MSVLPTPTLTLVVANPQRLAGGFSAWHCFDARGGCLGSDPEACDWTLPDAGGGVHAVHASLDCPDGRFILHDESGATYINGATRALGPGQPVLLSEGDTLAVGGYQLQVHLDHAGPARPDGGDLVALTGAPGAVAASDLPPLMAERLDPAGDPLAALGTAAAGAGDTIDPSAPRNTRHASIPPANDRPGGDREPNDGFTPGSARPGATAGAAVGDGAIQPLLDGLGVALEFRDERDRALFLAEAGEALRAAVEGLLALHWTRRQGVSPWPEWCVQPIEDNPLRLDQGFAETVRTLFSAQRSPVHLAPAAAVAEALSQLDYHQRATEAAIEAGLQALMEALAPDALQRRFQAYGPPAGPAEKDAAWAWRMYRHYFDELASDRQQGLGRLFWAVFGQAYDQAVRGHSAEGAR